MSKDKLDEFLGKSQEEPLETDKIYGGNTETLKNISTKKKTVHGEIVMGIVEEEN